MNRGVIAYMREGNRCAKNTFKRIGNILKFYFLEIVSFFGSLFLFPIPMMTLARMRVARLAERDEDIQIFKSFEKTDSSKHFWTITAFHFMTFILFLAGIVFIVLLMGVFGGIGLLIGGVDKTGFIIGGILAVPFAIVLLIFLILFPFMLMPAIYLYDCNTNLGLSGMFYNSIDAMRKTGKWTTFMMNLVYFLRHLVWLILIGGCTAALILYFSQPVIRIISAVLLLVFLVLYFFRAAKLLLGRRVASVLLYNDICSSEKYVSLAPVTEENTPKNVYGVSKRTLRAAKKEQLLLGLFTNGPKLKDPEGIDQSKLPNEVESEVEEEKEEEILAKPVPENVVEIEDNKNPSPEQPKPVYENARQIVVSTDPEDPTNKTVSKLNHLDSKFTGSTIGYFGMKLLTGFLNVITLGIMVPWTTCMMERWYASHTYINGRQLRFDGRGGALFGRYILWTFLTIITFGIFGFWYKLKMEKWITKHIHTFDEPEESELDTNVFAFTGINILTSLIKIVTFGIAAPWATAMKERWLARHTIIDGYELRFKGRGGALFGRYILWGFLTIITFGIFGFSFDMRVKKWIIRNKNFVVIERHLTNIDEVKLIASDTYDKPMASFNEITPEESTSPKVEEVVNEKEIEKVEVPEVSNDEPQESQTEEPVMVKRVFGPETEEITSVEEAETPKVEATPVEEVEEQVEEIIETPVVETQETQVEEPVVIKRVFGPETEETVIAEEKTESVMVEEEVQQEQQSVDVDELIDKLASLQTEVEEEQPKAKRGRKKATETNSDN